jgi:hypothetical protein
MSKKKNKNKFLSVLAIGLFVATGTYNAIVINSESYLTDVTFVKRLDELYGITKPGREVAASIQWQKLTPTHIAAAAPKAQLQQAPSPVSAEAVQEAITTTAAVQEELNLHLTEVINPKKYTKGITSTQFSGALQTNNGVIDSLNVSLPNGEGLSVSFSEMAGNVFEYDIDGNLYSGMMYQVDSNAYMVTLTNGPLEGTRLKFSPEAQVEQVQPDMPSAEVASSDVPTETFQEELKVASGAEEVASQDVNLQEVNADALSENDKLMQQQSAEAQSFNMPGTL